MKKGERRKREKERGGDISTRVIRQFRCTPFLPGLGQPPLLLAHRHGDETPDKSLQTPCLASHPSEGVRKLRAQHSFQHRNAIVEVVTSIVGKPLDNKLPQIWGHRIFLGRQQDKFFLHLILKFTDIQKRKTFQVTLVF